MTAAAIRESFLDFFRKQGHTIVPSASLLPQSPGLLFTNAGMNQFVPYFLGTETAPYDPPRAADTQKCIRAGGKHNDLEDVGYDTYHHTMFEMLGNWSFGDYFKKEAIAFAWDLVVETWGLPAQRLYASVYAPKPGDPGEFDQEAWDLWAERFRAKGLDPHVHIVHGNVKDNFWMMGETGPCGPCSELHVDLTPLGDSEGRLVNGSSDLCIEIWNLVFIQYNAEADGSYRELPAKHVDTGMGFERACSIIQCTKGFTDFSRRPSNYNTDVFQPLFAALERMSGKTYQDIYPDIDQDKATLTEEIKTAVAFRVMADHVRTLAFSIADGIMPGNTGRNYVLRRILRRAVRYGRQLGFSGERPFFAELAQALITQMSPFFPELHERAEVVCQTLMREEASFNETLDRGLRRLDEAVASSQTRVIPGDVVFELYDTYGFPSDLTALVGAERGFEVDMVRFEELMEQQRARARSAQKSTVVRALDVSSAAVTEFVENADLLENALVLELHPQEQGVLVVTDRTPFYAEMGGQVGDLGFILTAQGEELEVLAVQQIGQARAHMLASAPLQVGDRVHLRIDARRRRRVEAHHTATHLLHWALHEIVSADAVQQGSLVDADRLRFDVSSAAINEQQLLKIENLVNEKIRIGDPVFIEELPHAVVKGRKDVMQFFGDKYGERVRVVQVGGAQGQLNGFSMELCGGTHVGNTTQIGRFLIKSEAAVAAGVRRIEAVCGEATEEWQQSECTVLRAEVEKELERLNDPKLLTLPILNEVAQWKAALLQARALRMEQEKEAKRQQGRAAAIAADSALESWLSVPNHSCVLEMQGDATLLQELLNGLKKRQYAQSAVCMVLDQSKLLVAVFCGASAQSSGFNAGSILNELLAPFGGKGGGNAEMARGALTGHEQADLISAAFIKRLNCDG